MKTKVGFCKCGCGQKTSIAKVTNTKRGHIAGQPVPYINAGHAMLHKAGPDYKVDPHTGCWLWLKNVRMGYGRKWDGDKLVSAHVWYWEQKHGPIPPGTDLDHLCHNRDKSCKGGPRCRHRRCVNPDHLEPATRSVNVRRGRTGKLTAAQVAEIKAQPRSPMRTLAATYGTTIHNIAAIHAGKTWIHIEPAPGFEMFPERKVLGAPTERRRAPLTEEEAAEIRAAPRVYGSGRALAHKFGVADSTISAIRTGQN